MSTDIRVNDAKVIVVADKVFKQHGWKSLRESFGCENPAQNIMDTQIEVLDKVVEAEKTEQDHITLGSEADANFVRHILGVVSVLVNVPSSSTEDLEVSDVSSDQQEVPEVEQPQDTTEQGQE